MRRLIRSDTLWYVVDYYNPSTPALTVDKQLLIPVQFGVLRDRAHALPRQSSRFREWHL
jgi:hypothetical protein